MFYPDSFGIAVLLLYTYIFISPLFGFLLAAYTFRHRSKFSKRKIITLSSIVLLLFSYHLFNYLDPLINRIFGTNPTQKYLDEQRRENNSYVAALDFMVYEPTYAPNGYRIKRTLGSNNSGLYNDYPKRIEYNIMTTDNNGHDTILLTLTEFKKTVEIAEILDPQGKCIPESVPDYLNHEKINTSIPYYNKGCYLITQTPKGYKIYTANQNREYDYQWLNAFTLAPNNTVIFLSSSKEFEIYIQELEKIMDSLSQVNKFDLIR